MTVIRFIVLNSLLLLTAFILFTLITAEVAQTLSAGNWIWVLLNALTTRPWRWTEWYGAEWYCTFKDHPWRYFTGGLQGSASTKHLDQELDSLFLSTTSWLMDLAEYRRRSRSRSTSDTINNRQPLPKPKLFIVLLLFEGSDISFSIGWLLITIYHLLICYVF